MGNSTVAEPVGLGATNTQATATITAHGKPAVADAGGHITTNDVSMTSRQRVIAFIVMTFGMFMASLDIQIVASSITEIQGGLSATSAEISLIQTSYLIAEVIMIPMSGWLSRMLSTRWLFTISAAGFTLSSLGCALAWNIESMVFFRTIQGFLGGAMIPTVFAAGFVMFSGKNQTKIPAILGLIATLAPALGPSIGGLITDSLSWRWLFFINIVPGILITIIVPRIVKIDKPNFALLKKFDMPGAILMALFLGSLQYVLDEGPRKGWFEDTLILGLVWVAIISAVFFIWRSLQYTDPIVDLRAFKTRNFAIGCVLSFAIGVGLYGSIYLTPVFLGHIRGYNALQIGTTVLVVGLCNILATPLTVVMLTRVNIKVLLLCGFSLFGLSCFLFSRIDASWGPSEIFIPQALRGFATMLCIIPVTGLALGSLSPDQVKGGSGLYNLMRNLGGAIGLAAINSGLFYDRLGLHYDRLLERVNAGGENVLLRIDALAHLLDGRLADPDQVNRASLQLFARVAQREALTISFSDVFLMIAAVFVVALFVVPFIDTAKFAKGMTRTNDPAAH